MPRLVYKIFEYSCDDDDKLYRRFRRDLSPDHPLNSDFDSAEEAMEALVKYEPTDFLLYRYDIVMQVRI